MGEDWYVTDIKPESPDEPWVSCGLVAELNPSSFALRGEALKFGLTPSYLHPRNPPVARLTVGIDELDDFSVQITILGGPPALSLRYSISRQRWTDLIQWGKS